MGGGGVKGAPLSGGRQNSLWQVFNWWRGVPNLYYAPSTIVGTLKSTQSTSDRNGIFEEEKRITRRKTVRNDKVAELEVESILKDIEHNQLRWFGYVVQMVVIEEKEKKATTDLR